MGWNELPKTSGILTLRAYWAEMWNAWTERRAILGLAPAWRPPNVGGIATLRNNYPSNDWRVDIQDMQSWINASCGLFVNPDLVPGIDGTDSADGINVVYTLPAFRAAAGLHADGFERILPDDSTAYGTCQPGDKFTFTIFNEILACFNQMYITYHYADESWPNNVDTIGKLWSGAGATAQDAIDDCIADTPTEYTRDDEVSTARSWTNLGPGGATNYAASARQVQTKIKLVRAPNTDPYPLYTDPYMNNEVSPAVASRKYYILPHYIEESSLPWPYDDYGTQYPGGEFGPYYWKKIFEELGPPQADGYSASTLNSFGGSPPWGGTWAIDGLPATYWRGWRSANRRLEALPDFAIVTWDLEFTGNPEAGPDGLGGNGDFPPLGFS